MASQLGPKEVPPKRSWETNPVSPYVLRECSKFQNRKTFWDMKRDKAGFNKQKERTPYSRKGVLVFKS